MNPIIPLPPPVSLSSILGGWRRQGLPPRSLARALRAHRQRRPAAVTVHSVDPSPLRGRRNDRPSPPARSPSEITPSVPSPSSLAADIPSATRTARNGSLGGDTAGLRPSAADTASSNAERTDLSHPPTRLRQPSVLSFLHEHETKNPPRLADKLPLYHSLWTRRGRKSLALTEKRTPRRRPPTPPKKMGPTFYLRTSTIVPLQSLYLR